MVYKKLKQNKIIILSVITMIAFIIIYFQPFTNNIEKHYGKEINITKNDNKNYTITKPGYYDVKALTDGEFNGSKIEKGTVIQNVYYGKKNQMDRNVEYSASTFNPKEEKVKNSTTILLKPNINYTIDFSKLNENQVVELIKYEPRITSSTSSIEFYTQKNDVINYMPSRKEYLTINYYKASPADIKNHVYDNFMLVNPENFVSISIK